MSGGSVEPRRDSENQNDVPFRKKLFLFPFLITQVERHGTLGKRSLFHPKIDHVFSNWSL